jgi:hypothetical protein
LITSLGAPLSSSTTRASGRLRSSAPRFMRMRRSLRATSSRTRRSFFMASAWALRLPFSVKPSARATPP